MKKYPGIDYAFRPASYWADTDVQQAVLRDVQGTRRRELLADALRAGRLEDVPEELQQSELTEDVRRRLGQIHPSFMGGEYLPTHGVAETEIARIQLRSTTSDVISIRARLHRGVHHYRVVDEYQEKFTVTPATSRRPFTLGQLVRFIDNVRHPCLTRPYSLAYNELNADHPSDRPRLRGFTRINSDPYPGLFRHYEHVFDDWVAEAEDEAALEDLDED